MSARVHCRKDWSHTSGVASALEKMATNPDLVAELGRQGRARFERYFSVTASTAAVRRLYEALVSEEK